MKNIENINELVEYLEEVKEMADDIKEQTYSGLDGEVQVGQVYDNGDNFEEYYWVVVAIYSSKVWGCRVVEDGNSYKMDEYTYLGFDEVKSDKRKLLYEDALDLLDSNPKTEKKKEVLSELEDLLGELRCMEGVNAAGLSKNVDGFGDTILEIEADLGKNDIR